MDDDVRPEIECWLRTARESVAKEPSGLLLLARRIELWQLLDLAFPSEWHFRRCALSFMAAWDTLPEWYALVPSTQMTAAEKAYPREILDVARRVLLRRLDRAEARTIIRDKRLSLEYVRSDLPDGRELTAHWAAAICAMETAMDGEEFIIERTLWSEILSGRVVEDDIEPAERDVHFFAAFQFAQPNITPSPEELAEKYRIFWLNWLTQKVRRVVSASSAELREWIRNA